MILTDVAIGSGLLMVMAGIYKILDLKIDKLCKSHKDDMEDKLDLEAYEIKHKVLEADLDRGNKRFDKIDATLEKHGDILQTMQTSVALIVQKINNGGIKA